MSRFSQAISNNSNANLKSFSKYVSMNILGLIAFNAYILADTLFISNGIGLNALAALNFAFPVFGILSGCGMMLGMGGATKYAVLKAQGEDNSKVFAHSLALGVILSIIFVLLGVFASHELSVLLGARGGVAELTEIYLRVILLFAPAFIINHICVCYVRNDNSPALAMAAVALGSIANVILDYVFIYPLEMGIFGAVLATGLSPCISLCILSVHWIARKSNVHIRLSKPDFRLIGSILRLGVFSFVLEIAGGVAILIFNLIIMRITGELGIAAYSIIANIYFVAIGFFNGVAQGMQPLVSRAYGLNSRKDVKQLLRYGMITALVIAFVLYILIAVFAEGIVGWFNSDNNVALVPMATLGCRIYFVALIFVSLNIVVSGFMGATERGGFAFLITVLKGFIVLVPLVFLLAHTQGLTGVWLSIPLCEALVSVMSVALMIAALRKLRYSFKAEPYIRTDKISNIEPL